MIEHLGQAQVCLEPDKYHRHGSWNPTIIDLFPITTIKMQASSVMLLFSAVLIAVASVAEGKRVSMPDDSLSLRLQVPYAPTQVTQWQGSVRCNRYDHIL